MRVPNVRGCPNFLPRVQDMGTESRANIKRHKSSAMRSTCDFSVTALTRPGSIGYAETLEVKRENIAKSLEQQLKFNLLMRK
jgi:hypothetical protein